MSQLSYDQEVRLIQAVTIELKVNYETYFKTKFLDKEKEKELLKLVEGYFSNFDKASNTYKYLRIIIREFVELLSYLGIDKFIGADMANLANTPYFFLSTYIWMVLNRNMPFLPNPPTYPTKHWKVPSFRDSFSEWVRYHSLFFDAASFNPSDFYRFIERLFETTSELYSKNESSDVLYELMKTNILNYLDELNGGGVVFNMRQNLSPKETLKQLIALTNDVKRRFLNVSGIQPLTRKQKRIEEFDGTRGMLDVPASIIRSINRGKITPFQQFKQQRLKEPPLVYLCFDISSSMLAMRYAQFLCAMIIEIFADVSRLFKLNYVTDKPMLYRTLQVFERKEEIFKAFWGQSSAALTGTSFFGLEYIAYDEDLRRRGKKFIIMLTDAVYENYPEHFRDEKRRIKKMGMWDHMTYWLQELFTRPDCFVVPILIDSYSTGLAHNVTRSTIEMELFLLKEMILEKAGYFNEIQNEWNATDLSMSDIMNRYHSRLKIDQADLRNMGYGGFTIAQIYEIYRWKFLQYMYFENFFYTNWNKIIEVGEFIRILEHLKKLNIL